MESFKRSLKPKSLHGRSLYPEEAENSTQVLFINFGENETDYCLPIIADLRKNGIKTEIYPDSAKMKKQMSYANSKRIPFVALAGENEINTNQIKVKNMITGEQKSIPPSVILTLIKNGSIC